MVDDPDLDPAVCQAAESDSDTSGLWSALRLFLDSFFWLLLPAWHQKLVQGSLCARVQFRHVWLEDRF